MTILPQDQAFYAKLGAVLLLLAFPVLAQAPRKPRVQHFIVCNHQPSKSTLPTEETPLGHTFWKLGISRPFLLGCHEQTFVDGKRVK